MVAGVRFGNDKGFFKRLGIYAGTYFAIVVIYNGILFSFPNVEVGLRDVSYHKHDIEKSYDFTTTEIDNRFLYADALSVEVRRDGKNVTTVKLTRRNAVDFGSYSEAVILAANQKEALVYQRWLDEMKSGVKREWLPQVVSRIFSLWKKEIYDKGIK